MTVAEEAEAGPEALTCPATSVCFILRPMGSP